MTYLFLAVGAVLCFEGLLFALAPRRLEEVMAMLARLSADHRRAIGLGTFAAGVAILWLTRLFGQG